MSHPEASEPPPVTSMTLTARFERFHRDNPTFYDRIVHLARRYLARTGASKVGVQRLVEVARWDHEIATDAEDFKVNNDYASFYARLIALQEPDLADAFHLRRADEADEWIASYARAVATIPAPRGTDDSEDGR